MRLTTIVLAGVDTLHLHTTAPVKPAVVQALREGREEAKVRRKEAEPPMVQLGHLLLPIRAFGGQRGPYLLKNELLAVSVNPDPALPEAPTVFVELYAIGLWRDGWESSGAAVVRLMEAICDGPVDAQVSRIDICVDFQGWQPRESDRTAFVSRARKIAAYWTGRRSTGFTFGKSPLRSNIYDKRMDNEDKGKRWFEALWRLARGYDRKAPVWRLEFQVHREALKDLQPLFDFGVWENLRTVVPNLWELLTEDWLRFGKRTAEKRKVAARPWRELQAVENFGQLKRANVDLYKLRLEKAHAKCLAQFMGYAARGIAELQHEHRLTINAPSEAAEAVWLGNLYNDGKRLSLIHI